MNYRNATGSQKLRESSFLGDHLNDNGMLDRRQTADGRRQTEN